MTLFSLTVTTIACLTGDCNTENRKNKSPKQHIQNILGLIKIKLSLH